MKPPCRYCAGALKSIPWNLWNFGAGSSLTSWAQATYGDIMTPYESRLRGWARYAGMADFLDAPIEKVEKYMVDVGRMPAFLKAFPYYENGDPHGRKT